ncbi:hypothetical protein [Oleiharenicola lentus]|uniref:hypothetical protein n=1 Tax=Oleiharenicola lentus TaxID=2508720 RepID=UPI003F66CF85
MTHFPANPRKRPMAVIASALAPIRDALNRDIVWNRPLFKAPDVLNANFRPDPLPFMAQRVTERSASRE